MEPIRITHFSDTLCVWAYVSQVRIDELWPGMGVTACARWRCRWMGGASWRPAELGPDLGRFSWRQWTYAIASPTPGEYTVMAKATNRVGASQTFELVFNPAGYHNNVVQSIRVKVA